MNIDIEKIIVPEGRRELSNLDSLAESIGELGLINPITVTEDFTLIAGYHRLEACRKLGWAEVPVNVMTVDEIDAAMVEIDENLKRNEYSILEESEMLAKRKKLYEAKHPSTRNGGDRRSAEAKSERKVCDLIPFAQSTAEKTNQSRRTVETRVSISENIDPQVRDLIRNTPVAENNRELLALSRLDEPDQRRVAEKIANGEKSVKQVLRKEAEQDVAEQNRELPTHARILLGDGFPFLAGFEDQSIDLLLTDPPYSTELKDITTYVRNWVPLALSRVKPTGRAYICTGAYPVELAAYLNVLMEQDYLTLANVLVWAYQNTIGPTPKYNYKTNWQAIFYLKGGEANPLNCPVMTEQFSVQNINAPDGRFGVRYHTWQKPDVLAERLIRHSTKRGDLVVDPFAGTGTFLLKAAQLGRQALGCEIDTEVYRIALERGCVDES